jgi:hypothetical protein
VWLLFFCFDACLIWDVEARDDGRHMIQILNLFLSITLRRICYQFFFFLLLLAVIILVAFMVAWAENNLLHRI